MQESYHGVEQPMTDRGMMRVGIATVSFGLVAAVLSYLMGWRDVFFQTAWIVGLGVAAIILSREKL